jgi:hypothetical protein
VVPSDANLPCGSVAVDASNASIFCFALRSFVNGALPRVPPVGIRTWLPVTPRHRWQTGRYLHHLPNTGERDRLNKAEVERTLLGALGRDVMPQLLV